MRVCDMQKWLLNLGCIVPLWSRPEADLHLDSKQMGPTPHLCRVQFGRPCMLCSCLCIMANNDGKASQVCCTVSANLLFLLKLCLARDLQCSLRHCLPPSRQDRAAAATRPRLTCSYHLICSRPLIFPESCKSRFMGNFQEADLCL